MNRLTLLKVATLTGYFGIWILIPVWYGWLVESTLPLWLILGVLLTPLLFPLRGLLMGRAYTYAWSAFLALLYFAHGISESWTWPEERLIALLEVGLSILWFACAMFYARLKALRDAQKPDGHAGRTNDRA